jgi:ssDNA-binding Zn-finger/Zn-ribbon topoisomerase 1
LALQGRTGTSESRIGQGRSDRLCPKCGGRLVPRVARRGTNAGRQFLGCSNFPRCRYIEDMGD